MLYYHKLYKKVEGGIFHQIHNTTIVHNIVSFIWALIYLHLNETKVYTRSYNTIIAINYMYATVKD